LSEVRGVVCAGARDGRSGFLK